MNLKRLTTRIWPVAATASTDAGDNNPQKDGERKRLEHSALAEAHSQTGRNVLLVEMASQSLHPAIAAQLPPSTKVTISDAGREANEIDAQIQEGPTDQTRLYHLVARFPLW